MNAYLYTSSRAMHSEILNLLLPPVRLLSKCVLLLVFADVCRTSTFAVLSRQHIATKSETMMGCRPCQPGTRIASDIPAPLHRWRA